MNVRLLFDSRAFWVDDSCMERGVGQYKDVRRTSRAAALGAVGVALGLALSGCGSGDAIPDQAGKAALQTSWAPPSKSNLVFDGRVVDDDGGIWPMNCYANKLREVRAIPGDTLFGLAHKAGTSLLTTSELNGRDPSPNVLAVPLATINHLANPDEIDAGHVYQFPDFCRMG